MIARELVSNNMPILNLNDKVYSAISMMDNYGVSHLPIVHDGVYVGLISESQLYQMSDPNKNISECYYSDAHMSVFESQHLYDVVGVVSHDKLTIVPVISKDHKYIGSIISFDLLLSLDKLLGAEEIGTVVVLELNAIDYSLSQIAQIVEYNNSKIISLYTNRKEESKKMELTLKIESDNIISVLESFNRYEYHIKAVHASDSPQADIFDDRYDNLMNFLNI